MSMAKRLSEAWAALRAREMPEEPLEPGSPESVLARVRIELEEARREIGQLREEYARRERQAAADIERAGSEALLRLARRVGPLLSQFATMRALAAEGREVRREDLLTMAGKLEAAFSETGISSVGVVGAETAFDPKLHQRMSGGDVSDGDPVRVRFVGYKCGETVVTKAMVSRKE